MHLFAQATLDMSFLGLGAAVLVPLVLGWLWVDKKISHFNQDTSQERTDTLEELNRKIYKEGTAPLLMSVNAYISEQASAGFNTEEQEVISRYEESRMTLIDPEQSQSFIDLSNFPDTIEYEKSVKSLISSYSEVDQHNENYRKMKKALRVLSIVIWFPIGLLILSMAVHVCGVLLFDDANKFKWLSQPALVIGLLLTLPTAVNYIVYSSYVKKIDRTKAEDNE